MINEFIKKLIHKERILNLSYRILTIIFRFLLSVLIVKKLSVYDLGVFGIFQTTIILLVYLLGFDFYTYNTRELLKNARQNISYYISNQIIFHCIVYLVLLPFTLLIFLSDLIESKYLFFFYLVLLTEHISQELYRILIALKKSVAASLTLFLRSGLWIFLLFVLWETDLVANKLENVFFLWFLGALFSIFIALFYIKFDFKFYIDYNWIKNGVKIASPFLLATVFFKIIEYSGRFFLDFYWSKEEVGIFTFYSGISNAVFVFVQSTVIIVMSPYLIESANKNRDDFIKVFKNYKKQLLFVTLTGFIIAALLIVPLVKFLEKPLLMNSINVFYLLLIATATFCLSYVPHYFLYAYHKDKSLLIASIVAAIVNIIFNFLLVPIYGVHGAAFTQILSFLTLLVIKEIYLKKLKHEHIRFQ